MNSKANSNHEITTQKGRNIYLLYVAESLYHIWLINRPLCCFCLHNKDNTHKLFFSLTLSQRTLVAMNIPLLTKRTCTKYFVRERKYFDRFPVCRFSQPKKEITLKINICQNNWNKCSDLWIPRGGVTDDLDKYDDLMTAFIVILT